MDNITEIMKAISFLHGDLCNLDKTGYENNCAEERLIIWQNQEEFYSDFVLSRAPSLGYHYTRICTAQEFLDVLNSLETESYDAYRKEYLRNSKAIPIEKGFVFKNGSIYSFTHPASGDPSKYHIGVYSEVNERLYSSLFHTLSSNCENVTEVPLAKTPAENINEIADICHKANVDAGWWNGIDIDVPMVVATKLCLIHSEISEAMEGDRKGLPDEHLPHRSMFEVELADAFIRILDLAKAKNLDLGGAVFEKLAYNKIRADHKQENRDAPGGKKY